MTEQINPCQTCATNQECCKVMGLKLSKRDFEKHFKKHSDRLSIIKYNEMFIVYPRNKRPCPYWDEKKGCGIYEERPIDCRLYPYDLHQIVKKNGTIEISFYDQTDCPHKEDLFIPVDEAKELMKTLARDVFGEGKSITIQYNPGEKPPIKYGILNPLIAWLSKIIRAYR